MTSDNLNNNGRYRGTHKGFPDGNTPNTVKEGTTKTTATYILYSDPYRETTSVYFDTATWTDKGYLEVNYPSLVAHANRAFALLRGGACR